MKLLKYISALVISGVALASCEDEPAPRTFASLAVIHAAPVTATTPNVTLFLDNRAFSPSFISYNTSVNYLGVEPKTNNLELRTDPSPTTPSVTVLQETQTFNPLDAYTFVAYDTLTNGRLRLLKLKDDLTVPTGLNCHVRFLHLALAAPAVDITIRRDSMNGTTFVQALDSTTLTNRTYIGATPNATQLAAFTPIRGVFNATNRHVVRVKFAGTQSVVTEVNFGTNLFYGRIATIWATGTVNGRPLAINLQRNF
jgi:hypothetical protein